MRFFLNFLQFCKNLKAFNRTSTNQPTKMKATIENIDHLTLGERSAVKNVASTINTPTKCANMEDARTWADLLSGWFIYEGGKHLAIHKANGDPRRIMIVTA